MKPMDIDPRWLSHAQAPPTLSADHWLAGLPQPAWLVDAADGRVQAVNAAACAWLGQAETRLCGTPAHELLPSLEDAAFWAERAGGSRGRFSLLVSDVELLRPDGRAVTVARRIAPLGEPVQAFLVTLQDRSSEMAAERERDTLLGELRATLEATADGILVTDPAGRICAFNRRFAALWQLPPAALTGQDGAAVQDWMDLSVLEPQRYRQRLEEIGRHLLMQGTDQVALLDGRVLERHTQPQWSAGRPIGRVYSFRELVRGRPLSPSDLGAEGADDLTGWPNRAAFLRALDQAVDRARTEGVPLSLLCVEFERQALYALDGNCRVQALSELAEGLRACVREPHLMARLGAGRFAVLLRQSGEAGAELLAQRLVALASPPSRGLLATAGLPVQVGVAVYPQAGLNAQELLHRAEMACQRVAHAVGRTGWQRHEWGSQSRPQDRRRQRLERLVAQGLAGQALRLHFQPRVDAHSHQIQAVEALLRWQDGESGLLLPGQFLRQADEAGCVGRLDDWALEQALHQAARWQAIQPGLRLTVNLSAATLAQPALTRRVAALLQATGLPASLLELDVTEQALERDPDGICLNLQALHRLGVHLTLDAWGVGNTSLAWLRRLPWQAVKFDRSVLRHLPHQPAPTALVQGLAQLALALELPVWACGVETPAQRDWLMQTGCSAWQGLLAMAAMEPKALERAWLTRPEALQARLVTANALSSAPLAYRQA